MERQGIYMDPKGKKREVVSMRCFLSLFDWPGRRGTMVGVLAAFFLPFFFCPSLFRTAYLGMMRSGDSRMDRQPSAQNAYAPCASASG